VSNISEIFNDLESKKHNVVVIGGGTGLPVILRGLKQKKVNITAIVNVSDDGGSSGRLCQEMDTVPPGDLRNVLAALSNLTSNKLSLFQYRFAKGDHGLAGHSLGNLVISALTEMHDGINAAVQELSQMMKITGRVYPASNERLRLYAEFKDNSYMSGEHEISYAHKQIKRVWVENYADINKEPKTSQAVLDSIINADQIILGPGSLFTSILPNLMISNLGDAILKSHAQIVYICNIMTQSGETEHFTDADHVKILNQHLGSNFVDIALVNTQVVPTNQIDYQKFNEIEEPVQHDNDAFKKMGCRVITDNFLKVTNDGAFHDANKVADTLMKLSYSKER
jgi:uncharacterized cofD-like protein